LEAWDAPRAEVNDIRKSLARALYLLHNRRRLKKKRKKIRIRKQSRVTQSTKWRYLVSIDRRDTECNPSRAHFRPIEASRVIKGASRFSLEIPVEICDSSQIFYKYKYKFYKYKIINICILNNNEINRARNYIESLTNERRSITFEWPRSHIVCCCLLLTSSPSCWYLFCDVSKSYRRVGSKILSSGK